MTLLIAGALGLDAEGVLSGSGALAAIAAAPLSTVQLWARGGAMATPLREILERRHIDLSGVSWDGAVSTISAEAAHESARSASAAAVSSPASAAAAAGAAPADPDALGDNEPTSADDLRAVLVIGLSAEDEQRALRAAVSLEAPVVIVAGSAQLAPLAASADGEPPIDVRIETLDQAQRLTGTGDALAAAKALQAAGARAVVLTAGMLGGVVVFGDRAISFPSQPVRPERGGGHGALAVFAGAVSGWCAGAGADFTALKRACATASVVAGIQVVGGTKRLLGADRAQYLERFNRLRRIAKA